MGYRSRRQPTQAIETMQSLMALRESESYQNGEPEIIATAAMQEFAGEVALQNLMGNHNVPRSVRHRLHVMAQRAVEEWA